MGTLLTGRHICPVSIAHRPRRTLSTTSGGRAHGAQMIDLDMMAYARPLPEIQELARRAEGAGLGTMWLTESGRTAYLSCAAAALVTERIGLGTAVAVAFPRSPMITAKVAWELAEASQGRFTLGLGTQIKAHIERRYSAEYVPPGPRMRDYVRALRAIFAAF